MSTLGEFREGLGEAWEDLAEGWRDLWRRAEKALTRFRPPKPQENAEPEEVQLTHASPRWGLIPAEVYDEGDKILVRLEAPGMAREDFDVQVQDNVLRIRGEKHIAREEQRGEYFLTERAYGRFERVLPLPAGADGTRAAANYRRGVLTVTLPKRPSRTIQHVQIRS